MPASAVTPLDPEMIQIGNAVGQGRKGAGPGSGCGAAGVCCRSPRTRAARSSDGAGSRSGSGPPRPDADVIEVHQEVPGLLYHPGLDRVLGGYENLGPAATVLGGGQKVHLAAVEQVGGEEVQRQ